MTAPGTVERLFETAAAIEKRMLDSYCRMRQVFSRVPAAETFWLGLRNDEIDHIVQLDAIRRSLGPRELGQPAGAILEKAVRILSELDPADWETVENLGEAYDLACRWENSEANQLFILLASSYVPERDRKDLAETVIEKHLERLMGFPETMGGTETMKRFRGEVPGKAERRNPV
ncbi:MAG TPA: hypothetical protein PK636_02360 [bacterium]|nr:hypothetical protein [bacterium]HPJ71508.1 hypothetical protein [bacterium]HPQ65241.1 hypothetical protein [bacterium]